MLIPNRYFVTSGRAMSKVSELNAFDLALYEAGIEELNLVAVSSIIPPGAEMVEPCEIPMGAITHCVLAQMRGREGDTIAAGIAFAKRVDGKGGYVVEGHHFGDGESMEIELRAKIGEMERIRDTELEDPTIVIEEMKVPKGAYGCCLASLVFCGYR